MPVRVVHLVVARPGAGKDSLWSELARCVRKYNERYDLTEAKLSISLVYATMVGKSNVTYSLRFNRWMFGTFAQTADGMLRDSHTSRIAVEFVDRLCVRRNDQVS